MRGVKPNYSGAVTVDGAAVAVLDAPGGASPYTFIFVVNSDNDNDCVLMFGDADKFYIPKGFIGGFPGLVCNSALKAKKVGANVQSLYVTAW